MHARSGQTLSRYRLVEKIGEGGMGVVWKAEDLELGRAVAIKLLLPDMANDRERLGRFRQEARALAALNHPGIVTIHSVEECEGTHFLTMELVAGRRLDEIVPAGLELDRFLDLAMQLTDALAKAHERGIVHRDLKPANIMVSDEGRVKVLDFGLARPQIDWAGLGTSHAPTAGLTAIGTILGTPLYMSPEQLEGKAVDPRSDIFSLGVVLFELATGRRPFGGASMPAVMSSIFKDEPPPLNELREGWPAALGQLVARCLEKDREKRIQRARELHDELGAIRSAPARPASGTSAVESSPMGPARGPSIAVLPLRNLSGDPEQEYFADGLTEDLITGLSRHRWLMVISRNSSFVYKGQAHDVREVAGALAVRYVLEGSVRRAGERIRLTIQLADGLNGNHLWAERFDREIGNIFDLQDELTQSIAGAIEPELSRAEQLRAAAKRPENLDAWDCYQRGMFHLHRRTREDLAEAIRMFESALERDPRSIPALAASAEACFFQIVGGYADDPAERAAQGLRFARAAVELDPQDPGARYALGRIHIVERRHDAAIPELLEAIRLNPSHAGAHYALGMAYGTSGQPEAAFAPIEAAMRLSPHDPYRGQFMVRMGEALLFMGRYEEALDWAERSLREPNVQWSRHALQISALGHLGRFDEARGAIEQLLRLRPEITVRGIGEWWPVSDTAALDRLLEGLRKAGLPAG